MQLVPGLFDRALFQVSDAYLAKLFVSHCLAEDNKEGRSKIGWEIIQEVIVVDLDASKKVWLMIPAPIMLYVYPIGPSGGFEESRRIL